MLHSTIIVLFKYQILTNYFFCTITNTIHTHYPFHLFGCFQSFGHSFRFRHLLYCLKKRFLCVLINLLEIAFKCTVRSFFLSGREERSRVYVNRDHTDCLWDPRRALIEAPRSPCFLERGRTAERGQGASTECAYRVQPMRTRWGEE